VQLAKGLKVHCHITPPRISTGHHATHLTPPPPQSTYPARPCACSRPEHPQGVHPGRPLRPCLLVPPGDLAGSAGIYGQKQGHDTWLVTICACHPCLCSAQLVVGRAGQHASGFPSSWPRHAQLETELCGQYVLSVGVVLLGGGGQGTLCPPHTTRALMGSW
jgi:hypothetical protein